MKCSQHAAIDLKTYCLILSDQVIFPFGTEVNLYFVCLIRNLHYASVVAED